MKVFVFFSLSLAAIIMLIPSAVLAQPEPSVESTDLGTKITNNLYLNYFLLQPTGFLYFDQGADGTDSLSRLKIADFYKDGNANFSLQMLGVDFFFGEGKVRGGLSCGLGISLTTSSESNLGSFFIGNAGLALTFNQVIRLEVGYSIGISAKENLDRANDQAFYIGLSFPTKLGEELKKVF